MQIMIHFKTIVERIQDITGMNKTRVARELFDISLNNLNNKIRRNSVDIHPIAAWAMDEGVNIGWLLTGMGSKFNGNSENHTHIDTGALSKIIEEVDGHLKSGKKDLPPEIKARLTSLLYNHFVQTGKQPNPKTIASYLELIDKASQLAGHK